MRSKKVLFVLPYPLDEAPSQRFRLEQYFSLLKENNILFRTHSFFNLAAWKTVYQKNQLLKKSYFLVAGFTRRLLLLFTLSPYDFVFIHREATPVGPPWFEWVTAKILRKKIIYDFDDAIWETDKIAEPLPEKLIRWRTKVGLTSRWSYAVSCGNNYLCDYARQFNARVVLNPTTIDTDVLHNRARYTVSNDPSRLIIGWTGSHSTLKYLKLLEPALTAIQQKYPHIELLVIADRAPALDLQNIRFRPWSKATEVSDLMLADIGIMPLPDDAWSKGKCGFKALQYMALGIPCLASPVGVNTTIIQHGSNGFLCGTDEEWIAALEKLIHDEALRKQIGRAGRKTVVDHYSVNSNSDNFLSFFQ